MKKILLWTFSVVLIAGILYVLIDYMRPQRVENEYSAMIYENTSGFAKAASVRIQGDLRHKVIGKSSFSGKLAIDGKFENEIELRLDNGRYFGLLATIDEYGKTDTRGAVSIAKSFDRLWILSDDVNAAYELDAGYIAAPASTREEANAVANRFVEGYE